MSAISEIEAAIQTLVDAKGSGFTNAPDAGVNQINHWLEQLRSSNSPALRPVAHELEQLMGHFQRNNTAAAAASLQTLGEHTAVVAKDIHTFEGTGDKLRHLSQALVSAAGNLRIVAGAPVAH